MGIITNTHEGLKSITGDLNITTLESNADVLIKGNDGGASITALTLDMSDSGAAYFNDKLYIPSYIAHTGDPDTVIGFSGNDTFIIHTAGTTALTVNGSQNATFAGTIGSGAITSTGNIHAGGSLRSNIGSDNGSQLNLWAESNGSTFLAGYNFAIYTGGNNSRTQSFIIDQNKNATFAGDVTITGELNVNDNLDFSGGTQKKIILGSQKSYVLPAQNTRMRILTLANLTSCRVYLDSSENAYNQPIVLDIFYNSQGSAKPKMHRTNNKQWHTHSNDIRFTSDTSGHIYAEKVAYSTSRNVYIRKVEEFKGTVTILDGSTTNTGGGANEVYEASFATLSAAGKITGAELEGTSLDINGNADISGNTVSGGDINFANEKGIKNTNGTHKVLPYDPWGNMHISVGSGGFYLDAPIINLRELGSTGNKVTINNGNLSATGSLTGTSLDINGAADISGNLTGVDTLTATTADLTGNLNFSNTARIKTSGSNKVMYIQNDISGTSYLRLGTGSADLRVEVIGTLSSTGNVTLPGIVLDGNTITGVDDSDEFTDDDAHIMTSAAVNDRITSRISGLGGGTGNGDMLLGTAQNITANKEFQDNVSAFFGTSGDLRIQHDGSHSYISHGGVGHLYIQQNTVDQDLVLQCDNGSGGTTAYLTLDGSVARTIANRNIRFPDGVALQVGDDADLAIYHQSGNSIIANEVGPLILRQNLNDGDIIFQTSTGTASAATYITLDGSDAIVRVHVPLWISEYIVHIGDTNTYFGFSAADTFVVHAGATGHAELTITGTTAAFAGKVLVNQSSDLTTQTLQVNGFIDITDVTGTALRWYNGSTFRGGLGLDDWAHSGSSSDITMYISGDNSFHVSTNNVKRAEFNATGLNVVGELEADSLDIDGNADISGNIVGGGKLEINQAGNGTSNVPSAVAEFSGQAANGVLKALSLVNSVTAASGNGTQIAFHNASNYSPTGTISVIQAGDTTTDSKMEFQIYRGSLQTALTIDHDSNIGIGTSSPDASYDKTLHILGTNPTIRLETNNSSGWAYNQYESPEGTWSTGIAENENYRMCYHDTLGSGHAKFTLNSSGNATFTGTVTGTTLTGTSLDINGNASILSGASSGNITVGRNANENTVIHVGDQVNSITAYQDADGNATHNFTLNRVFGGTGANDFKIQKGGTDQFTLDTSANATFAGQVSAAGSSVHAFTTVQGKGYSIGSSRIVYYDGTTYLGNIDNQGSGSTVIRSAGSNTLVLEASQNATFASNVYVGGTLQVTGKIEHGGDSNTYFGFDLGNDTYRVVAGGTEKLRTAAAGIEVNGELQCDTLDVDGNADITGNLTVNSGGIVLQQAYNLNLGVSGYDLKMPSSTTIALLTATENAILATVNAGVKLYFNNAVKLETVTGGANVTGTLTATADVIAYSDERLKENVQTLDGKKVLEMRGVSFDRLDDGKSSSGVIAQELEKVAPELVVDDGDYKGVAYGNLVGYLIEAVKDQQKQINELKAMINGNS